MNTSTDRESAKWMIGAIAACVAITLLLCMNRTLGAAALGVAVGLGLFAKRPKLGFLFWLASICMVPCWIGIAVGGFLPAGTIGSILALTCLLSGVRWHPSVADLCVVALILFSGLGVAFGSLAGKSSLTGWESMVTLWLAAYLVGRFVCQRAGLDFVRSAVAIAFGLVGFFAILEGLLGWHPFVSFGAANSLAEIWSPIQVRGGVERSEWAFGHSIALGGALALAIPFVITSPISTILKFLLLGLIGGGVAMTLSRGAMLAAGLTLFLSLIYTKEIRGGHKVFLFAGTGLLGIYTAVNFLSVSEEAGSEVSDSSGYRVALFSRLISTLVPLGRATSYRSGGQYGNFTSIDNAFMAIGLGYGWIPMIASLLPFVFMAVRFLRGRASFPELALLGQLPVITTVAMITQYQMVVWMVAGLAASMYVGTGSAAKRVGHGTHVESGQQPVVFLTGDTRGALVGNPSVKRLFTVRGGVDPWNKSFRR